AYRQAEKNGKLLVVDFGTGSSIAGVRQSDRQRHELCRVGLGYRAPDSSTRLIDHASFAALGRQPGLAIVDVTGGDHHGAVVSVLPQSHCTPDKIAALLALPEGTLTQRTLTWAFFIHPERPRSV